MLKRDIKTVQILTYPSTKDAAGQTRQGTPTERNVEMVCKIYKQSNIQNPRYIDVEMIGLTKDTQITTANAVKIDNVIYNVLYVIPSSRDYQILMKRK